MKDKYLISASTAYAARQIAKNMNLDLYEYIHIKSHDGWPIRKCLLGMKTSKKRLVGYFSEPEKEYLLRGDIVGHNGKYSQKRKIKKDQ